MFLEDIVDFWKAVPTQCSFEVRKGLGFLSGSDQGMLKGEVSSEDPSIIPR